MIRSVTVKYTYFTHHQGESCHGCSGIRPLPALSHRSPASHECHPFTGGEWIPITCVFPCYHREEGMESGGQSLIMACLAPCWQLTHWSSTYDDVMSDHHLHSQPSLPSVATHAAPSGTTIFGPACTSKPQFPLQSALKARRWYCAVAPFHVLYLSVFPWRLLWC